MRPDTPAENVDHNAEAARLERTADRYPEDAEALLVQAAAHLELAGDRPAASSLYDRLLAAQDGLENPYLVRALKAANLWEYGHEAEARAIIEGVRVAAPRDPAPWVIVAEALESHDELEQAQETFTEGARVLLTDVAEPPYSTHPLLFGRHRVRRMLGLAHDEWDTLADTLHSSPVSLDELHDPKRVWSLGSDNPAELEAEISRLRAELGTYREALSRPFPVAVLHWLKIRTLGAPDGVPLAGVGVPLPRGPPGDHRGLPARTLHVRHPEPGHRLGHGPVVRGVRGVGGFVPRGHGPAPPVRDDTGGPGPRGGVAAAAGDGVLVRVGAGLWGVPRGVSDGGTRNGVVGN